MSRPILVFGQSGVGKSYSLKNLDPNKTLVIDADKKGSLPFRGSKKLYTSKNFSSVNSLDAIKNSINKVGKDEKFSHITTLAVDGISNALATFEATYMERYNPKNNFEPYQKLKSKAVDIFDTAKDQRDDLNVIFLGNVKLADPYQPNSIDRLLVPGNYLKENQPEANFNYVFYAKIIDGKHVFETFANKSAAKTPEGCFPDIIENDLAYVINTIDNYENGGDAA